MNPFLQMLMQSLGQQPAGAAGGQQAGGAFPFQQMQQLGQMQDLATPSGAYAMPGQDARSGLTPTPTPNPSPQGGGATPPPQISGTWNEMGSAPASGAQPTPDLMAQLRQILMSGQGAQTGSLTPHMMTGDAPPPVPPVPRLPATSGILQPQQPAQPAVPKAPQISGIWNEMGSAPAAAPKPSTSGFWNETADAPMATKSLTPPKPDATSYRGALI